MSGKTQKILAAIIVLLGLGLLLSVKFIFPPCSGMVTTAAGKEIPMRCHYTSVCLVYLAVLLIVSNIAALLSKQYKVASVINIAVAVLTFLSIGKTLGMGLCADLAMACHPMAAAAKVIMLVAGILSLLLLLINNKEK